MSAPRPRSDRSRRRLRRRLAYGVVTGVAAAAAAGILSLTYPVQLVERKSFDARTQLVADPGRASDGLVAIDIDENSLQVYADRLGRWPWSRDAHAALLSYAAAGGARLVVFDVLFPEPDLTSPATDSAFADELADARIGLIAMTFSPGDDQEALTWEQGLARYNPRRAEALDILERFRMPLASPDSGSSRAVAGISFPYPDTPDPMFLTHAAGVGGVNLNADPDGVVRWERLVYDRRGEMYPSLALAAARLLEPDRFGGSVRVENGALMFGTRTVPVGPDGRMLVRWHGSFRSDGQTTYVTYPAFVVLDSWESVMTGREPAVPLETFKDKVVFVGVTAAGATDFDVRATPVGAIEPGVLVQMTALDNLLAGDALRRVGTGTNMALVMLVGTATGLLTAVLGSGLLASAVAAALLVALLGGGTLLLSTGWWIDVVAPGLALALAFAGTMVANYMTEGREKRRVRDMFSRYVSPEYVRRLADDLESLELGGERAEITILFSDIRGFTSLSERLPASQVLSLLNEYLDCMTDVVFRHGGTLDKFIGDAVMAFWGAPVAVPDHAQRAASAALEMIRELDRLNERWREQGSSSVLAIGIGINTGEAIVGNIGSLERKLDYTAIGDPVNLASRLESLNKEFGTSVLVSENTAHVLGEDFDLQRVESVTVRGKAEPVDVYELRDRREPKRATPGAGKGALISALLLGLLALPGGAGAQESGRSRWTDWVYRPGSWAGGQLVRASTTDPETDSLALLARVEVYSSPPRWRLEVARMEEGQGLSNPVVVVGGTDEPVVLSELGSTPLAEHAIAEDSAVSLILGDFSPSGDPLHPPPARLIEAGADGEITLVLLRRPVARAEFGDDLFSTGSVGRLARSLGRFGVGELGGERDAAVVASAGPRGVARVRTVDGEIEVDPDPEAIRRLEELRIGILELERFLRELRKGEGP